MAYFYYSNNSKSIYVTKGAREDGYNFISAQVRRLLGSCTHLEYIFIVRNKIYENTFLRFRFRRRTRFFRHLALISPQIPI